jgi:hypothetical protein
MARRQAAATTWKAPYIFVGPLLNQNSRNNTLNQLKIKGFSII